MHLTLWLKWSSVSLRRCTGTEDNQDSVLNRFLSSGSMVIKIVGTELAGPGPLVPDVYEFVKLEMCGPKG
jgi:hypothetical protein